MAFIDRLYTTNFTITRTVFLRYFFSVSKAFRSWNDNRMTRNALLQLSPRQLKDIGLVPGDIDQISRR
tara:strand:+ start:168 stop:371 length:204 start_codon:yes stop_codon:yes gene_type:complete